MKSKIGRHITATLLLITVLGAVEAHAEEDIVDHISGRVDGGSAKVMVVAWGAAGPENAVQLVKVSEVPLQGDRFDIRILRSAGERLMTERGLSFRGWGVRVESVNCGELELRPPAMRLRDNCEAGWLIRPWDEQPLNVQNGVVFHIVTKSSGQQRVGGGGQSYPPASPPQMPPANNPPAPPTPNLPPSLPPAAPASPTTRPIVPTAAPPTLPTDVPMLIEATPTMMRIGSGPQPTAVADLPTEAATPPAPAIPPTATPIPIIIEQDTTVNVTPLPTQSDAAMQPTRLAAVSGNTGDAPAPSAPTPEAAPPTSDDGGGLLGWLVWVVVGVVVLSAIAVVILFIIRQQRRRTQNAASYAATSYPLSTPLDAGSQGYNGASFDANLGYTGDAANPSTASADDSGAGAYGSYGDDGDHNADWGSGADYGDTEDADDGNPQDEPPRYDPNAATAFSYPTGGYTNTAASHNDIEL